MPDISIGRFRGGFCVYWPDADTGKRRRYQLAASTAKEAEAEAVAVYRERTFRARGAEPTIADLWSEYRADLGAKSTAKTMKYTGKAVLRWFGAHPPSAVTVGMCRDYSAARTADGMSQGTIWTELGHLRSTLVWAQKRRMIAEAPYIWKPAKPETDKRILSRGEAAALIDGAHDPHIRLALILLFGTAARVGAILDLTWDRVNFDSNSINLRLSDSATRKGRAVVPMNGMVRAALSTAHSARLTDNVVEYAGKPVKSIRTGFTGAIQRSGIGHLTIHEIRHTAAVTMLSEGVPIEKVSQMLGHSNTSVTFKVYGRYLPGHMQDAADILDFSRFSQPQKRGA